MTNLRALLVHQPIMGTNLTYRDLSQGQGCIARLGDKGHDQAIPDGDEACVSSDVAPLQ